MSTNLWAPRRTNTKVDYWDYNTVCVHVLYFLGQRKSMKLGEYEGEGGSGRSWGGGEYDKNTLYGIVEK